MITPLRGRRTLSPMFALCLALIGAGSMLYYHLGLFIPRVMAVRITKDLSNGYSFGNDFYQVWLSAREFMHQKRDPYSAEMTREIQTGLYGRPLDPNRPGDPVDQRAFPYPAFTELLFWPTTEFPFPVVRIAVVSGLALLTLASVALWLRALKWRLNDAKWLLVILLLTISSYPSLEGLFAGQLGMLVAFLVAAALAALQRDRFLLAGIFMALTTIKPQVTALLILFLLIWSLHDWRMRGRFWIGFFSTMTLLVGTALAVLPGWIQSWAHTILAYRHYTHPPLLTEVVTSLLGPRLSGPATLVLTVVSIVIAVALCWQGRTQKIDSFEFWITVCLLLSITTITLLPGQAVYDHLILLPAILLLVRSRWGLIDTGQVPRILFGIGGVVLFWPWIAAFALVLLRFIAPVELLASAQILSLPIRTAASLPFAVLALLGWTWRSGNRRLRAEASATRG